MPRIVGKLVFKINNSPPVTADGPWSVNRDLPNYYSYGMLGYNGFAVGTQENVAGSFQFVIPATGLEMILYNMQAEAFTVDFPMGDPALGAMRFKAIDCLFTSLALNVDSPNGRTLISGNMKAGMLNYPMKITP